jgi:hypothetical protein
VHLQAFEQTVTRARQQSYLQLVVAAVDQGWQLVPRLLARGVGSSASIGNLERVTPFHSSSSLVSLSSVQLNGSADEIFLSGPAA